MVKLEGNLFNTVITALQSWELPAPVHWAEYSARGDPDAHFKANEGLRLETENSLRKIFEETRGFQRIELMQISTGVFRSFPFSLTRRQNVDVLQLNTKVVEI